MLQEKKTQEEINAEKQVKNYLLDEKIKFVLGWIVLIFFGFIIIYAIFSKKPEKGEEYLPREKFLQMQKDQPEVPVRDDEEWDWYRY